MPASASRPGRRSSSVITRMAGWRSCIKAFPCPTGRSTLAGLCIERRSSTTSGWMTCFRSLLRFRPGANLSVAKRPISDAPERSYIWHSGRQHWKRLVEARPQARPSHGLHERSGSHRQKEEGFGAHGSRRMTLAGLKAKAEEVRPIRPDLILQAGLPLRSGLIGSASVAFLTGW